MVNVINRTGLIQLIMVLEQLVGKKVPVNPISKRQNNIFNHEILYTNLMIFNCVLGMGIFENDLPKYILKNTGQNE